MKIKALAYSSMLTMILVVFMTVLAELSTAFKTFLTSITGHHWTTKGIFALIFFALSYFILSYLFKETKDAWKETKNVAVTAILGGLIIFLFFVWEFLK